MRNIFKTGEAIMWFSIFIIITNIIILKEVHLDMVVVLLLTLFISSNSQNKREVIKNE